MPVPNCPVCDRPLEPLTVLRGDTPPWYCQHDSRSFWEAELEVPWDPYNRSEELEQALNVEVGVAKLRGFSISDNSIEHVPQATLDRIEQELGRRGDRRAESFSRMRGRR